MPITKWNKQPEHRAWWFLPILILIELFDAIMSLILLPLGYRCHMSIEYLERDMRRHIAWKQAKQKHRGE